MTDMRIVCRAEDIEPSLERWLEWTEEEMAVGACEHPVTMPMGPRWLHCIDCSETLEAAS